MVSVFNLSQLIKLGISIVAPKINDELEDSSALAV